MHAEQSPEERADQTDQSLVARVRAGDEAAATALYERYARRVFGLVKSKLGAHLGRSVEPDDIVQSVFKSIFKGVQSGAYNAPHGSSLWSLLTVIAVHKLSRKAEHHSAQCRDARRQVSLIDESDSSSAAADRESVEFLELCIRESLESLRPRDRNILTLRIQNHTIREISERTGCSLRTIERSLCLSRQHLASLLPDNR